MNTNALFSAIELIRDKDSINEYLRLGWLVYETEYVIDEDGKRVAHYLGWPIVSGEPKYPEWMHKNR